MSAAELVAQLATAAADVAPEAKRTVGQIIKDAAAYLLALGVILGVVWRVMRPHFERLVREAAATRTAQESTSDQLGQLPATLQQIQRDVGRLADLPERVNRLEGRADVLEAGLFAFLTGRNPAERAEEWREHRS